MFKKIIYVSLFVMVFILAVQSVGASDTDFNTVHSNDINLDDSVLDSSISTVEEPISSSSLEIDHDAVDEKDCKSVDENDAGIVVDENDCKSVDEDDGCIVVDDKSCKSVDGDDGCKSVDEKNGDGAVDDESICNIVDDINEDDDSFPNEDDVAIAVDEINEDDGENIGSIVKEKNLVGARDDGYFLSASGDGSRNLTVISADSISFDFLSEGKLKINLTDESGKGLANKLIFVKINGKESNLTTNKAGLAIFNYSGDIGKYNVNISFKGDGTYAPSSTSATINITKASTQINTSSVRSFLTCSTYVVATLLDSKGNFLANKNVYLVISGITYNATTNRKGVAKIKIPTKISNFTVSVRFAGDGNYTSSVSRSKVVITKMKTYLIVPVVKSHITKNTYLDITLQDYYGKALANKTVYVTVGNKTYNLTTNKKGIAKLKLNRKIGTFKCIVKFNATDTFYASSKVSKVIITKTPVVIKAPRIIFKSDEYGRFRINLSDIDGRPLKNQVVSVSIPSLKKSYKVRTNAKGIATLRFCGAKSYYVVVRYGGNKYYYARSFKSSCIIKKVKVKLKDVLGAAEILEKYISKNKKLPKKIKYKNYVFTTPQLSYLMAVAIKHIKKKNKNAILSIIVNAPSKSTGEIYDTVLKKDFVKIAKKVAKAGGNHRDPSYVKYWFYKVPYKVYTAAFSRILTYYKENGKLPNYALFTNAYFVKVKNPKKYTFYLTTDNIAGKKSDLKMLKKLAKAIKSKGYQAIVVGIGPDIHNKAYRFGCVGKKSVLLCCFGGVDVGCIEEWAGDLSVGDGNFVKNYNGAHVLGLWYTRPYGASASLHKKVGQAWDANYGFALANPAKYMSKHHISYIETGTVSSACKLLKAGKMGGPKLIR